MTTIIIIVVAVVITFLFVRNNKKKAAKIEEVVKDTAKEAVIKIKEEIKKKIKK